MDELEKQVKRLNKLNQNGIKCDIKQYFFGTTEITYECRSEFSNK